MHTLSEILADKPLDKYESSELKSEYKFLEKRSKLGFWREEEAPDVEGSVNRITWILNGSFGCGAMLLAEQIIRNNIAGKKGKMLDKAWLAIGKELTLLAALHDSTEYTFRKITEVWKKQGINFSEVNAKAAAIIQEYLSEEE
jgi:hypothetical protein